MTAAWLLGVAAMAAMAALEVAALGGASRGVAALWRSPRWRPCVQSFRPRLCTASLSRLNDDLAAENAPPLQEQSMEDFIRGEIRTVIELLVKIDEREGNEGLDKYGGVILTDNNHVLCKGRVYEQLVGEMLKETVSSDQSQRLERIHALVSGFLDAERKARARTKMNYILAGAQKGSLEEAVDLLRDTGEIDRDLLTFLDFLVETERERVRDTASLSSVNAEEDIWAVSTADADRATHQASQALQVLLTVRRRLLAEAHTQNQRELRILAALLNTPDPEQRLLAMRKALTTVEAVEAFAAFLVDGIAHLNEHGLRAKGVDDGAVELPAATVEVMKDTLRDLEDLRGALQTGQVDKDTTFSLSAPQ